MSDPPSDERLRFLSALVDQAMVGIIASDRERKIRIWSRGAEELLQIKRDAVIGRSVDDFEHMLAAESLEVRAEMKDTVAAGETWEGEIDLDLSDGLPLTLLVRNGPLRDEAGEVLGYAGMIIDISERKRSELRLQQAERLEAVGQLAGGIAHDFNNLLSVVLNYAQFLIDEATDEQTMADLREIEGAAKRAAELTRQLLIFSRRDASESIRVDLAAAVQDTQSLLRRTIGEHLELVTNVPPELSLPVELGPGQADQILINLVVNARDAVGDGGKITIEVSKVIVGPDLGHRQPPLAAGRYAMLVVVDDGVGMGPEVIAQAFEPFFSTKPKGVGTGLGLATVYGIVNQWGGHVEIESEVGSGTSIRVCLPLLDEPPQQPQASCA